MKYQKLIKGELYKLTYRLYGSRHLEFDFDRESEDLDQKILVYIETFNHKDYGTVIKCLVGKYLYFIPYMDDYIVQDCFEKVNIL